MIIPSSTKTSIFLMSMAIMVAVPLVSAVNFAYAQTSTSDFTVLSGDLKNNPMAQKILERIEIAKQRIAEMQQKQTQIDEQKQFLAQQRLIAKQRLNQELERMNDENKEYTPRASFTRFVDKTPEKVHDVYWGMFNYHRDKVKAAQSAMNEILDKGGSYQEAREAYNKIAAIKRVDLIQITKNLNVDSGLADDSTQSAFDKYGKLPRYDD